jgi:hypothetical protein
VTHEKIRVLVETTERSFRGFIHKPVKDETFRLSDHLNTHGQDFINLSDVTIHERGQQYRAGERRDFIAVQIRSITYITPCEE